MRLFEITSSNTKVVSTKLKKYCQPYLNEVGGIKEALLIRPLFRGMRGLVFDPPIARISVNQNRQPVDMEPGIQKIIDDWFSERTKVRFRQQSLFCSGDITTAKIYQEEEIGPLIVVPIGPYHYTWSPTYRDLYDEINWSSITVYVPSTKDEPTVEEKIDELLTKGNYQFDTGIREAIDSNHEIMLACKQAYVIKYRKIANEN